VGLKVEGGAAGRALAALPATFTYTQARRHGLPDRRLYRLRDEGVIESIGRGVYRRRDAEPADIDLQEVALRAPMAMLCLTSALARHDLTDEIPAAIDVALPRGQHRPLVIPPVTWHLFDRRTFDIGRSEIAVGDGLTIGLYGPERSIVDAVRLRHREGSEAAYAALRRWLRRRGSSPARLLEIARHFPQADKAIRHALEVIL
jgi:predicted transcriptional regulator of viral defense system